MTSARRSWRQVAGQVVLPRLPCSRRAINILRFELGCLGQRLKNTLNPAYHLRVARLRRRPALSLNVGSAGCGAPGWVNVDARASHQRLDLAFDIRRRFPLRDGQCHRIFAEHLIEHLEFRHEVPRVLREFHRLLQPGGRVRIIVPDARRFLEAYVSGDPTQWKALGWDPAQWPSDIYTPMHAVNHVFHQSGEHLFGYDFDTMAYALKAAGFQEVIQRAYGVSGDPALCLDQPHHAPYSLYVEARKASPR